MRKQQTIEVSGCQNCFLRVSHYSSLTDECKHPLHKRPRGKLYQLEADCPLNKQRLLIKKKGT